MKKISIVVPCYNEEEAIPLFYKEVSKIVKKMEDKCKFEFIFVNDGSRDNTLGELRKLASSDKNVRYISFSRNFGKEAGMFAGLEASAITFNAHDNNNQDCHSCVNITKATDSDEK